MRLRSRDAAWFDRAGRSPLPTLEAGSGTTMIAAERTGRRAVLLEIDPAYADVIVRRWQEATGRAAVLEGDDRIFADVAAARGDKAMPSLGLRSV